MWHYLSLLLRRTLWIFLFLFLSSFLSLHCPHCFALILCWSPLQWLSDVPGYVCKAYWMNVAGSLLVESQSASASLSSQRNGTSTLGGWLWRIPDRSQGRTKVLIMRFLIPTMPKGTYACRWKDKCPRLELEITRMPLSVIYSGGRTLYTTASLAVKQVVLRIPIILTSSPETIRQVRKVDMQVDFHFPWTTGRVACCFSPHIAL